MSVSIHTLGLGHVVSGPITVEYVATLTVLVAVKYKVYVVKLPNVIAGVATVALGVNVTVFGDALHAKVGEGPPDEVLFGVTGCPTQGLAMSNAATAGPFGGGATEHKPCVPSKFLNVPWLIAV